ncbi:transmembrane protein 127-like [Photinus pyralis]|uniref:transmembrane protein 127-like n=1 Tax=Photinus pyralis TaxID=7054 RepID=UPI001267236B|nr:transmembrane protein 127-like [Photinus pyralis]
MPRNLIRRGSLWMNSKLQYRNLVPAAFHIVAITLISMSLVQVPWFVIKGGVCSPYLAIGQFFSFGYSNNDTHNLAYCINGTIVNLMRTIILLLFMAIIFSLAGFFIDILGPKNSIYTFVRRYALASTFTVFWITAIICICYYVTILLEESLENTYPEIDTSVAYGYGVYLIASTGGIVLIGTFCTVILMQATDSNRNDERCLINRYSDNMETFDSPTPPPPYSIPPPPYTP